MFALQVLFPLQCSLYFTNVHRAQRHSHGEHEPTNPIRFFQPDKPIYVQRVNSQRFQALKLPAHSTARVITHPTDTTLPVPSVSHMHPPVHSAVQSPIRLTPYCTPPPHPSPPLISSLSPSPLSHSLLSSLLALSPQTRAPGTLNCQVSHLTATIVCPFQTHALYILPMRQLSTPPDSRAWRWRRPACPASRGLWYRKAVSRWCCASTAPPPPAKARYIMLATSWDDV